MLLRTTHFTPRGAGVLKARRQKIVNMKVSVRIVTREKEVERPSFLGRAFFKLIHYQTLKD